MIFQLEPEVMKAASQINPASITAAIMFSDIVGYTTLMEADQKSAMELLEKNRKLHQYHIEKNGGTWIKEMGDGILVSFETASAAVSCALDIQRSSKLVPGLKLRIGIHLGTVVFISNDVFGIVVNIASRLQCLAKPGQILVSASVVDNISPKICCQVNCMGNRRLKNVKQAVKVHRVGNISDKQPATWWTVYTQFPMQQAMALAMLAASLFRVS